MAGQPGTAAPAPWTYGWWAATGALLGLGTISILTIGLPLLVAGGALTVAAVWWSPIRRRSIVALPAGLAVAPAYLAWLNRAGPGTICERTIDEVACAERWSPWPFVAVAVVLVTVAIGLAAMLEGREN